MNKIINLDEEQERVTVESGIYLYKLNDYLAEKGFQLAC
jgi:FAD/FMN-containing dehydrogenase